jgi:hypothetical protein
MRRAAPRSAALVAEICAPYKDKFSRDVIEQPIAFFQNFDGNFFHLRNCVKVQSLVNTAPTLLAQRQYILNGALLLLPARIRTGFCDGPLRKIECIGKTKRYKSSRKDFGNLGSVR